METFFRSATEEILKYLSEEDLDQILKSFYARKGRRGQVAISLRVKLDEAGYPEKLGPWPITKLLLQLVREREMYKSVNSIDIHVDDEVEWSSTNDPVTFSPNHEFIKYWRFPGDECLEANLANAIANVAEKNGMSNDETQKIIPVILRILKSESSFAQ